MFNSTYLNSINEVSKLLITSGIEFCYRTQSDRHGAQLVFPWLPSGEETIKWCCVSANDYTGGHDSGKVEVFGCRLLSEHENEFDDVCGHLTPEEAYERIAKAWKTNNHRDNPDRVW